MKIKPALLGLLFFSLFVQCLAEPIFYNWPKDMPLANDFEVYINGEKLALYNTEPAAIAMFGMDEAVDVKIVSKKFDIKWLDIRPLSLNVDYRLKNNTIAFSLQKPANLSIELNNEHTRVLYLFASKKISQVPDKNNANTIYFEPGKIHDAGLIRLQSGQTLYIPGGAIVKGSILARNAENINITGHGILDGSDNQKLELPGWDRSIRAMLLENVKNSSINGLHIINSLTWTIEPMYATGLSINDVKIVNWDYGSDGIDMVGCRNVTIDNVFVRANDDCVVIKSWKGEKYDHDPENEENVSDITVKNSTFWNMAWGNALEIGFELRTELIENVTFKNCDILHVDRGAAISIHNGDYARVKNIVYEDIRIEDASHKLFDLAVFLSQYSLDRPAKEEERTARYKHGAWDGVLWVNEGEEEKYAKNRGHIKNIVFRDIAVVSGELPFSIFSGFDEDHQVENVLIENLSYKGRKLTTLEEAKIVTEHTGGIEIR
jgi:hypothetical protein